MATNPAPSTDYVDVHTVNTSGQEATVRLPKGSDMVRELQKDVRTGDLHEASVTEAGEGPFEPTAEKSWRRRGEPVGDAALLNVDGEPVVVAVAPVETTTVDEMDKDRLVALAKATGVEVNPRWGEARLREEIDKARAEA